MINKTKTVYYLAEFAARSIDHALALGVGRQTLLKNPMSSFSPRHWDEVIMS